MKDTKILIPEIPGEWTQRTRNGHTNVWNDPWHTARQVEPLPEVRLGPPQRGLYAERIDGAWYWVCGCEKCLGSAEKYSYITCHDHDRCEMCGIHREDITETPWRVAGGWACKPCAAAAKQRRKVEAMAAAQAAGHGEDDCEYTDDITCPYCASKISEDEPVYKDGDFECDVCGGTCSVEVIHSVSYTSIKKQEPSHDNQ